jgi:NADP-dependent 3-hydroxy acid dehydrogenase YdfG
MTINLKDKVVLITGASSGFGGDAARLFAAQGAHVILVARRLERLQDAVERIQAAGGNAMAVPVDVNNRADIQNMVQKVIEIYGHIDILFNNAGFGRLNWFDELEPVHDIQTQVNVNLTGLMQVTHAVLPGMIARRRGHIINISSVAGWIAVPMYTVYAATKYGVRGFTDALRREVSTLGIHVSGIYPGPAHTEFGQNSRPSSSTSNFKLPEWSFLTSEYVASKVVQVALRPRRNLILPWWFRSVLWADALLPGGVDWFVKHYFVQKYRRNSS